MTQAQQALRLTTPAAQEEAERHLANLDDPGLTEEERRTSKVWLAFRGLLPEEHHDPIESEDAVPERVTASLGVPRPSRPLRIHDGAPDYSLPHNLASEVGLLTRMASNPNALVRASELLSRDDWFLEPHRILFEAMVSLHRQGKPIDRAHLANELAPEQLKEVGEPLLATVLGGCLDKNEGSDLIQLIAEDSALRRMIIGNRRLELDALERRLPVQELASQARALIETLATPGLAPGWDPPLLDGMLPATPFPIEVLPEGLRALTRIAHDSMHVPPDYVAAPCLAIASGVIGRSVGLFIKEGWHEYAALFSIIVGHPGTGKTPALKLASHPIWEIFRELEEDFAIRLSMYRQAKREWDAERRGKGAKTAAAEFDEDRPTRIRIAVSDTTKEALSQMLWENVRGLLMIHDELSGWLAAMNQYRGGDGDDKEFFGKCFSFASVPVDRKVHGEDGPQFLYEPCLAIAGGIQPEILPAMDLANGRKDGFIDRFIFSFPEPIRRPWSDVSIPPELRQQWSKAVRRLWDREMHVDAKKREAPRFVRFSAEAQRLFASWYNELDKEMHSPHFNEDFKGAWSKFQTYGPRLALLIDQLHWAYDPDSGDRLRPVSVQAMQAAAKLIEYYKNHFRRVYITMRGVRSDNKLARDIVAWVMKTDRRTIRTSDVKDNFKRALEDLPPESLQETLSWLAKRNVLRRAAPGVQRRGRPSQAVFEVNPQIFEKRPLNSEALPLQ